MEDYPRNYVAANRPLVVFSGFDIREPEDLHPSQRSGSKISSDQRPVEGLLANNLAKELRLHDYSPLNGKPFTLVREGNAIFSYHIKLCPREYWLPCRKASPQAVPVDASYGEPFTSPSSGLHSPFSPLTASSDLHPDGLMTPLWNGKHQTLVPAALISIFTLSADPSSDTLNDNVLKNEINGITKKLEDSRQRVHHAVVILGNPSIAETLTTDERLSNIKKASKLDAKNGFFYLPPDASNVEIRAFVESLLEALKDPCIEHFRELTKHARRKRDRGTQPPTTPTIGLAKPLTLAGWRVRYEYKLGIFAEFRREYETSERHLATALESLLEPNGVIELTSNWSPRFNEYRLLSDVISLHLAKSYLMRDLSTQAVRFWCQYKARMAGVVQKQGKGTSNYGWKAWEARSARIFGQLIDLTPVADGFGSSSERVYLIENKTGNNNVRLETWDSLHHAGYWHWISAKYSLERMNMAEMIPEDDRIPPGQSPATKNARRKEMYDDYLCPDPHKEFPLEEASPQRHAGLIQRSLKEALNAFTSNNQSRMAAYLRYYIMQETRKTKGDGEVLKHVSQFWDKEGALRTTQWLACVRSICELLYRVAADGKDIASQVKALWELSNAELAVVPNLSYDLPSLLNSRGDLPISIDLEDSKTKSPISIEVLFQDAEGHAGEPMGMFVILTADTHSHTPALNLSTLTIRFDGAIHEVCISHYESEVPLPSKQGISMFRSIEVTESNISEGDQTTYSYHGKTSLELTASQSIVLGMTVIAREPGHLTPLHAVFAIEGQNLRLRYRQKLSSQPKSLHRKIKSFPTSRFYKERSAIRILPKLAKMEIYVPNQRPTYYSDERTTLCVEVTNKEHFQAKTSLEIKISGAEDGQMSMRKQSRDSEPDEDSDYGSFLRFDIGELAPDAVHKSYLDLRLPSSAIEAGLEMKLSYRLSDDPETPIFKKFTAVLVTIQPFQTTMKLEPCYHPEPWSSYFDLSDEVSDQPAVAEAQNDTLSKTNASTGYLLKSKWNLQTLIRSAVEEHIIITKARLEIDKIQGDGTCTSIKNISGTPLTLGGDVDKELNFEMELCRSDAAERKMIAVFPRLLIEWRRADAADGDEIHSTLPVPRLTFPTAEPRAIATRVTDRRDDDLIHVEYTLENPSMHLLTFNLTMELNEDFAFSGPKSIEVSLVPLSRHTVHYTFTPLVTGAFIQPRLKVLDVFFNRALPVQGTAGLKTDQNGILIWIDTDD